MSFVKESGAGGAPAEIEIGSLSTSKIGLLVTSFCPNHENICPEISLHILQTFKLNNAGHYIQDKGKSIPLDFCCSFWKISK